MTPNSEPFAGVEHTASVELDDDAEHIVVLQQVWNLSSAMPGSQARKNGSERKPANTRNIAVRSRCALFVIHDKTERLAVRKSAGAALDRLAPPELALEGVEIGN